MKKLLIVGVIAGLAVALSACSSTPSNTTYEGPATNGHVTSTYLGGDVYEYHITTKEDQTVTCLGSSDGISCDWDDAKEAPGG